MPSLARRAPGLSLQPTRDDRHAILLPVTLRIESWRSSAIAALFALGCGAGTGAMAPSEPHAAPVTATRIAAAASHVCALIDGVVWCVGENSEGALGHLGDPFSPARVEGLAEPIVDVDTSVYLSCACAASGRVYCWGNHDGHPGPVGPLEPVPTAPCRRVVVARRSVRSIGRDGAVTSWPAQVGLTRTRHQTASVELATERGTWPDTGGDPVWAGVSFARWVFSAAVDDLSQEANHSCVALDDGTVACWGFDASGGVTEGPLVDGTRRFRIDEILGTGDTFADEAATRVGVGVMGTCVASQRRVVCFGRFGLDGACLEAVREVARTRIDVDVRRPPFLPDVCVVPPYVPRGLEGGAREVGVTASGGCALDFDDRLVCWTSPTDAAVVVARDVVTTDIGQDVLCVLTRDGVISCWPRGHWSVAVAPEPIARVLGAELVAVHRGE